jgi:hypothetical protein
MLLPLYYFSWQKRKSYEVEEKIKNLFFFYILYLCFFTIFSKVPWLSAKGSYDSIRGLLLFPTGVAFANLVSDEKKWKIVKIIVFILVFGSLFFPRYQSGHFYSYYRNPNNAAVLLIFFISFLFPTLDFKNFNFSSFLSLVGFLFSLYLLGLTNSRGAWLGLSVAMIALMIRSNMKLIIKSLLFISILSVLFLSILEFNWKGFDLNRRGGLWSGLLSETIEKNFFIGYGFNSTKDLIDQLGLITRTAHNVFLEIFVTTGALGFVFILFLFFYIWKILSRYSFPNNHIVVSGIIAIVSFWVMGQFDLKFSSFRFMATNAFFLGMIYSQRNEKVKASVYCE